MLAGWGLLCAYFVALEVFLLVLSGSSEGWGHHCCFMCHFLVTNGKQKRLR